MRSCIKTLIILLFLSPLNSLSQQKVDDQVSVLTDKAKLNFGRPDSLLIYTQEAYKLANDAGGTERSKAVAAKFLGVAMHMNSRFADAVRYYRVSLNHFKALNDTLEIGKAYLNLATSYEPQTAYKETINNALQAIIYFKQLKDYNGEGRVYNLLGVIYNKQTDFDKALHYFYMHLDRVTRVKDSIEIATAYNNIGSTYNLNKKTDSAIFFLQKAEQLQNKLGLSRNLGSVYQNLGDIYFDKGNLNLAFGYFQKALKHHKQNAHARYEAITYAKLGVIYLSRKNYIAALEHLNTALSIGKSLNDPEILTDVYKKLANAEQLMGNSKQAYAHLLDFIRYNDTLSLLQNGNTIKELQTKYETEQAAQKIKDLNQQSTISDLKLRQQSLLLVVIGVLLISVSLLAYFIYYKRKQKEAQLQLQAALEKQQLEVEARQKLGAERQRISSDLHDNIGSYLTFINSTMQAVSADGVNDQRIDQLKGLTADTIKELRKTVWLINKEAVVAEEFEIKVREFFKNVPFLKVFFTGEATAELNAVQATELFRLIQEAVNNALKHSEATEITVAMYCHGNHFRAVVSDNGKGFDYKSDYEGFGLKNMRNRAKYISGDLQITAEPGNGTTVEIGFELTP